MLALIHPQRSRQGFSVIELMIGLVVLVILVSIGAPAFSTFLNNNQIRTATNAIQTGLQLARAEAVSRNATVFFSLTDGVTNTCGLSTSGSTWVVSLANPTGRCGDTLNTNPTQIIQIRPGAETRKAVITSNRSQISFNGLGRASAAIDMCIGLTADEGECAGVGDERRLRMTVAVSGQIRSCNPALSSSDPQGC
jgi:type IV fimbrial biogenesis protein FimT